MQLAKEGRSYSIALECPRSQIPKSFWGLSFHKVISAILGKSKYISIVFIRQDKMKRLNKKFRSKNHSTDILSFPLQSGGEVFLSINDVRKKAKLFKIRSADYLPYLLIHGLLHLKGYRHGSKMDDKEKTFCKLFHIKYPFDE